MIEYPTHAIKSESELRRIIAIQGKTYGVVITAWRGAKPLWGIRVGTKVGDTVIRNYPIIGTGTDRNGVWPRYYWEDLCLASGDAAIPFGVWDPRSDENITYSYIFANYWHAWAYLLKVRGKADKA